MNSPNESTNILARIKDRHSIVRGKHRVAQVVVRVQPEEVALILPALTSSEVLGHIVAIEYYEGHLRLLLYVDLETGELVEEPVIVELT